MYQNQGLEDIIYIMLYGGAAAMAAFACLYLLLRRGNAISPAVIPPLRLRR